MLAYCLEHVPEDLLGNPGLDYSREVSRLGAVLAADGFDPVAKRQLISPKTSHTVRALIAGCGLYEETGAIPSQTDPGVPGRTHSIPGRSPVPTSS